MNHENNEISTNLLYRSYLGCVIGRKDLFSVCVCVSIMYPQVWFGGGRGQKIKVTAVANILNRPILGGGGGGPGLLRI